MHHNKIYLIILIAACLVVGGCHSGQANLGASNSLDDDPVAIPEFVEGMSRVEVDRQIGEFRPRYSRDKLLIPYPIPLLHIVTERLHGDTASAGWWKLPGGADLYFVFINDRLETIGAWDHIPPFLPLARAFLPEERALISENVSREEEPPPPGTRKPEEPAPPTCRGHGATLSRYDHP